MKNSLIKRNDTVVHPRDMEQLTEWIAAVLSNRIFSVKSIEEQFDNEPYILENCRLDTGRFQSVFFSLVKMTMLFCIDGPDDVTVPVGGFGKLIITFLANGVKIENKGFGSWEFTIVNEENITEK